jgi:hypothetical protein
MLRTEIKLEVDVFTTLDFTLSRFNSVVGVLRFE